jgi:TATA-box binding protein (TBP) (component of TFIID and TFIIIB)
MILTNIKFSFKTAPISLSTVALRCADFGYKTKEFANFVVIRIRTSNLEDVNWVCTVFKKNLNGNKPQHVNVTNLKSAKQIPRIIQHLSAVGLTHIPGTTVIDNVTGLMTAGKLVLEEVIRAIPSRKIQANQILDSKFGAIHGLSIHYNNERFPGLFIKFKRNLEKIGTAILFHSGKIVIVGCKGPDQLKCLAQAVTALISIK